MIGGDWVCMEDIRIGRRKGCQWRIVTIDPSSPVLAPRDIRRTHIAFRLTNNAATCHINYGTAASATVGIDVSGTSPIVEFDVETHGQLVYGPWYGHAGANLDLVVYEATLPED